MELLGNAWDGWSNYITEGKLAALLFVVLLYFWFYKKEEEQKKPDILYNCCLCVLYFSGDGSDFDGLSDQVL